MAIHGQERLLSYFRIGSDMKAWRLANPGGRLYCYHDLIYHKGEICEEGNFLAVRVQNNSVSVAVILGLEENNPGVQVKRFQGFKVKSVDFHMYVLELSGQPLVACRLVDARTNGRTVGFQLYLVSVAGFRELVSLEDSSIFIGQNSSFSLSCIDYPRCRRNQIYFTKSFLQTDRRNRPVGFRCSDVGVCDFARNIIHQDERVSLFDGPPPIWITPFNYPSSSTLRFGPRAAAGNQKVNVKLVVIGHTSCGKSTIVGNLLHQLHDDVDNLLIGINRNNVAKFSFAWVLDKLKAERERGFSIDNASWKFDTRRYSCTLTVCPGRRDFIRNMITGASEADCVILIVDSGKGFEIGMSEDGQTREHVLLAYALGVKQIICCCNKMDATLGSYSSIRYYEIVKVMSTYLEEIGYSPIKIHFVPVSGLYGKNLVKWSSKMDWYNGPTLLEAINRIQEPKHLSEMPLCLPPRQMYYIGAYQASVGSLGCEYSGGFHTNTFAAFAPGESADVAMLLQNYKRDGGASTSKHEPAKEAVTFIAEIVLLKYPGRILNGFTAVVDNQSYHNTMRVEEVLVKIDEKTGKELPVMFLENKDVGIVKLCIMNMAVAESLFKYPPLGRFLLRDIKGTVAVGVIKSIDKM